jgi:hypothetical protein
MIRTEIDQGWRLVTHPDHARLAGELADAWGNDDFSPPEPFLHVRAAVYAHDDGWIERDAAPCVTRQGKPSAFSRELVGTYSAFEEIDLNDYLAVRGKALTAIAQRDPFAAVLVSMHTVNLLTEQADLSTLRPADRPLHAAFVASQREQQKRLAEQIKSTSLPASFMEADPFEPAFRFLQCCDSFSLLACVAYEQARPLRHPQLNRRGERVTIACTPLGNHTYTLNPWPLREAIHEFSLPTRRVQGHHFPDTAAFRRAWKTAEVEPIKIVVRRS